METLVSIVGVVFFFGSIVIVAYLSYLGLRRRLDTILSLVEKTGDISPELTNMLEQQGGCVA